MKVVWSKKKIICCCMIVVFIGVTAFLIDRKSNANTDSFQAVFEEEQTKVAIETGITEGIKIPGYQTISIAADQKNVSVNLENPDGNPCYFKIRMYLSDTEELLYESNLLKPGQHLYEIELLKSLAAGNYAITLQYETYSMDDSYTPLNGATSSCQLVVS